MTIELAPHHMLIVADHWAIIPWSALRKSRGFLGLCSWEAPALEQSGRERGGASPTTKTLENKGREQLEGQGMITQ